MRGGASFYRSPKAKRRGGGGGRRVVTSACAIFAASLAALACYVLYAYESVTITRLSIVDPLGGISLFPRVRTPCKAPSCEAVVPAPIVRDEDKVTVIIMGFSPTRVANYRTCLLYTSPSPRDATLSRMPSSA